MLENEIFDILEAMKKYGGSFVVQLAVLYQHGDSDNRQILLKAFKTYFQKYDGMVTYVKHQNAPDKEK